MDILLEDLEKAYFDCRKHKRKTYNALRFEINWETNLYQLYLDLIHHTYKISRSITFIVIKGVKAPREIFAADFRDRIVQHLLINKLKPYLDRYFIYRRFSCKEGFGTLDSTHLIFQDIQDISQGYTKDCWVAKTDIKAFFNSIDRKLLWKRLKSFIKSQYKESDIDLVLYITKLISLNYPTENCIRKSPLKCWDLVPKHKSLFSCKGLGLAIGNITSQIFACFYLTPMDKCIDKNFKHHMSWVDDNEISSASKEKILNFIPLLRKELSKCKLKLNENKFYIQHYTKGIKFAGSCIKPGRTYTTKRVVTNFIRKIHGYNILSKKYPILKLLDHLVAGINSYLGIMVHHSSYGLRRKILKNLDPIWFDYFCITDHFKKLYVYNRYRIYYKTLTPKDFKLIYGY